MCIEWGNINTGWHIHVHYYPIVPFGVSRGFPGPFMVHPGYRSMLPGCSNPEVSQSGTPQSFANSKVLNVGERLAEKVRLMTKDKWLAPEPMAAFLDKRFNRSLS